jgi:transposase
MGTDILPETLWTRIEPLLPQSRKNRHVQFAGRKAADSRRVLNSILFVLRTGIPGNWLPATSDFPSGHIFRRRLRRWQKSGVG